MKRWFHGAWQQISSPNRESEQGQFAGKLLHSAGLENHDRCSIAPCLEPQRSSLIVNSQDQDCRSVWE
ncbi:hypothetical protein CGZ80_13975 [Rhodopirellula sp. MGV]|nr:hypothetical protein CGZ80_13975 [Rhodopirellula sp. MGV]